MDWLLEQWDWAKANWTTILMTATTVVTAASVMLGAVSKLTKNKRDDQVAAWLKRIIGWLDWLSLNVNLSQPAGDLIIEYTPEEPSKADERAARAARRKAAEK